MRRALTLLLLCSACYPPLPDFPKPQNGVQIATQWMTLPASGEDIFLCSYLGKFDHDVYIKRIDFSQMDGGHHIAIFTRANYSEQPYKLCDDGIKGAAEMTQWRFVAGGVNESVDPSLVLPEGVALVIKAGTQIVLQSHYLNITGKEHVAQDRVNFHFTTVEESPTRADYWVLNQSTLNIPPGTSQIEHTCPVDEAVNVLQIRGHTHQHGVLMQLDLIDGQDTTRLYDETDGPQLRDNPPTHAFPMTAPLALQPGMQLRYRCGWNNTTGNTLGFPAEMCAAIMLYYPGKGFITCSDGENAVSP